MLKMIRVGINGYGTIGKRVADAVAAQDDMKIVGVTKTRPNFVSKMAAERYDLYIALPEHLDKFEKRGIDVGGDIEDLLERVDIIVDCSPAGIGAKNKALYEKYDVKAIFEAGGAHELTKCSFNAQSNYREALKRDFVRVVSCNTTGLCRTLNAIDELVKIKEVKATMIRRAADPGDSKKGPINAIEPVLKIPSHHGPDVQTVLPHIKISTMAVKVPTTIMHLHCLIVDMGNDVKVDKVIDTIENTRRVILLDGADGIRSTAEIMEYARDIGRKRGDLYEIAIWRDGISIKENTLYYYQAIHQESDVIPENIDAIRSMMGEEDAEESMNKTDRSLGII